MLLGMYVSRRKVFWREGNIEEKFQRMEMERRGPSRSLSQKS